MAKHKAEKVVTVDPVFPRVNEWWRKKSSGLPYCVHSISDDGMIRLLNDAGLPDGRKMLQEFLEDFYRIGEPPTGRLYVDFDANLWKENRELTLALELAVQDARLAVNRRAPYYLEQARKKIEKGI